MTYTIQRMIFSGGDVVFGLVRTRFNATATVAKNHFRTLKKVQSKQ
jgi:hypothetical protein